MIYEFDRYINGRIMAEGVRIERVTSFEEAAAIAARIASRGPDGENPVLILRPNPAALSPTSEPDTQALIGGPEQWESTAKSVASMVIEWVDGANSMGLDWRSGLDNVIQARLYRLAAPHVLPVSEQLTAEQALQRIADQPFSALLKTPGWAKEFAAAHLASIRALAITARGIELTEDMLLAGEEAYHSAPKDEDGCTAMAAAFNTMLRLAREQQAHGLKHPEYAHGISDAELIKEAIEFCNEELDAYEGMEYDDDSEVCCQRSNTFIRELVLRLAAAPAHPPVQVPVVKALDWEPHFYAKTDELVSLTADLPGREQAYKIETVTANINFRLFIEGREVKPVTGWYWPFDDAKAAAQSDYETRIRSALAPVSGGEGEKPVICIGRHTISQLMAGEAVETDAAIMIPASDLSEPANVDGSPLLEWAVSKWNAEVKNRPLVNVHRRSLDDVWRQVIRWAGGDPASLVGPSHDELLATEGQRP